MSAFNELKNNIGYFNFVLTSFGLERVRLRQFKEGEVLTVNDQFKPTEFQHQDKGISNMHTGPEGFPPISVLGTPVFSDVILTQNKKVDFALAPQDIKESVHMLWVLVEVEQTKNIVKTKVQGRDGEVKEYISDGDYMVTLRGAFADTFKKSYPKDIVKRLIRLCQAKEALTVTSEYLLMFGIHELVIESYKFAQEEGKQNVQKFELSCSSDVPLILKKKKGV